jgi:hypothetical protein
MTETGRFIVRCESFCDEDARKFFETKEEALGDVRDDAQGVFDELVEDGHDPVITSGTDNMSVYVPDTSIYYEWHIKPVYSKEKTYER